MTKKNPPNIYGESYLKSLMAGTGGGTRWENNPAFQNAAAFTKAWLDSRGAENFLDVGCGRGWVVHNLRESGVVDAFGVEYADEAIEHSVCNSTKCDLTVPGSIQFPDNHFDHVNCVGILSHLPEESAPTALRELWRVTKSGGTLWTSILCRRADGKPNPLAEHHVNQATPGWWRPLFKVVGWKEVYFADMYASFGLGRTPEQWGQIWEK